MTARFCLASIAFFLFFAHVTFDAAPVKPHIDGLGDSLPIQATHRFGTARFCTQAEVASLMLSHDGKLLAAADREGRVYLWDALAGKQKLITGPGAGKRVVLSPDGQWLAHGDDGNFEVRNLRRNDQPRLPLGGGPRAFAFSHDSKSIATTQDDEADVLVFDLETSKEIKRFAGLDGTIAALAFSPDGKRFAAAAPTANSEKPAFHVVVWDAATGVKRKEWDIAALQAHRLVFLPDGKTLIGQFGARLVGWDASTGQRIDKINQLVGSSFGLDAAGKLLASCDGPKVVEFATGKELHEFESPTLIRHLALAGDGSLLAASPARLDASSPRIMLWDLATGNERVVADAHRHYVDAVAFSHDGKQIATASNVEGMARIWDVKSSKLLFALNLDSLAAKRSGGPRSRRSLLDGLSFAADRPELFAAGQRWDLTKGTPIPLEADDDFRFEQTNSYRAVLTADARFAASFLSDHSILFWDPAKAKTIQKIEAEKKKRGEWSAFAFTPDGKHAITGKWFPFRQQDDETPADDTLHLWDVAAAKRVKSFRASHWPVIRVMLSPDGETLAVIGFPTKLELWHLPTGRLLREMVLADLDNVPTSLAYASVAFAPHGQWLAFSHRDGEIMLLETITGKEIQTLKGHQGFVSSLAFSPDNRRLLSGGRDTTALLWSVRPEQPELPPEWKDADHLWQLLGRDPAVAYRAVWALMAHPDRAIEVLAKRLEPDSGATEKEIAELINNLASARFAQRDTAMRRLKQIGTRSLPALEQALKKSPDLETARRIQELLRTVERSLTPETLRDLRGLQLLEMTATKEARRLLADIANGDRAAAKTRLAQAALERLRRTDGAVERKISREGAK